MNDMATSPQGSSGTSRAGQRKRVCVQGLGFVGAAVCIAVAGARDPNGYPLYDVIGIDQPTPEGIARIAALNRGLFPFHTTDATLLARAHEAHATGNLRACDTPEAFGTADIIIIDVPLDVTGPVGNETIEMTWFVEAVRMVGRQMSPDALVIVETTVPPGTTQSVVVPTLTEQLERRGLAADRFRLAHCYERVMPGDRYLDSIVNMPRVFAGIDDRSASACAVFLRSFATKETPPPCRLSSTTASELAKVLENSYRAVTIALMDEFSSFAEAAGVDLPEIIAPIRQRPTHNNVRTPGFGVGGYCLTKDPLLAKLGARLLFGLDQAFPFCTLAVETNRVTPLRVLTAIRNLLGHDLNGRRILLMGVSYRQDVGDTRKSASETFYDAALSAGATVMVHDPIVQFWREKNMTIEQCLPPAEGLDAVVLAVPHNQYKQLDYRTWLADSRPVVYDAFQVLTRAQRDDLRAFGCIVESIGRGTAL